MPRKQYNPVHPGQVFQRLTVIQRAPKKTYPSGETREAWTCRCECGKVLDVTGHCLLRGNTRSCGCLQKQTMTENLSHSLAHGEAAKNRETPEYRTWLSMRRRCFDPTSDKYHLYGGRGISVDSRWHSFAAFLEDMGRKPSPRHSIDRYPNNNGNYEPGNVRWATAIEQARNKRTNHLIDFHGKPTPLSQFAELIGANVNVVRTRIRTGWSIREIEQGHMEERSCSLCGSLFIPKHRRDRCCTNRCYRRWSGH